MQLLYCYVVRGVEDLFFQAPYVPAAYPDLTAAWHTDPMPVQEKVPGIQLAQVPLEYQYDSRLHHKHDTQSSSTT